LCILFGTNLVQTAFSGSDEFDSSSRNPAVYVSFAACYLIVVLLSLRHSAAILATVRSNIILLSVILFPFLSIAWSQAPSTTLQRSAAVLGGSIFGVYLAATLSLAGIIRLAANAACLMICAHLIVSIFIPSIGLMDAAWEGTGSYAGTWRGLTPHKNILGIYCALYAITLISAAKISSGLRKIIYMFFLLPDFALIFETKSATAVIVALVCTIAYAILRTCQKHPNLMIPVIFATGIYVLFLCTVSFDSDLLTQAFAVLERNPQMSGRFPLWDVAVARAHDSFWLGFGQEAFWDREDVYVKYIAERIKYMPHYSHNGFVETVLNGGVVLFAMFLVSFILSTFRSVQLSLTFGRDKVFPFAFAFFVLFALANITESHILARNSLMWALFVAISFSIATKPQFVHARTISNLILSEYASLSMQPVPSALEISRSYEMQLKLATNDSHGS